MIKPSHRTSNFAYAIRNLSRAAEERRRANHEVLYFNIGDPQAHGFRPPEHVTAAVERALRDSFNGYAPSAGLIEARTSIAAHATRLGAATTERDIIVTSGASEAADLLLTALVDEGDEVLVPAPGYPIYTAILNKLGAQPRPYHLHAGEGWQLSVDEIYSLVNDRTRAIVLINPSNPTGAITPDATTRALLELAREHNLLVISDEVYRDLCFDFAPTSASVLAGESGACVATLESLSKTHMIPGWRIGWMRFTNSESMPELVAAVGRLADGRLCSPTPAQYAVRPALEGSQTFLTEFMCEIRRRRDFVVERIGAANGLSCTTPAAAFYVMVDVAPDDAHESRVAHASSFARGTHADAPAPDERFVLDLLAATGVLVVHGSGFGAKPHASSFRLVYLADTELLGTALDRITNFVAERRPTFA